MLAPDSSSNLCVVGDANQSIYGFRGANASYILKFTEDYPEAKIFRLTKSYRCSQTILSASSNVIEQSSGFLEGVNEGVRILVSEQPSGAAEAEFISRRIVDLVGGVSFFSIDSAVALGEKDETINSLSDFAVLCRTRNQFDAITKALLDHHVPYQEIGTAPFFRQEPFQSLIDLIGAFTIDNFESAEPVFRFKKIPVTKMEFEMIKDQMKNSDIISFLKYLKESRFSIHDFEPEKWNQFLRLASEYKNTGDLLQFLKLGIGSDVYDKNLEAVSVI